MSTITHHFRRCAADLHISISETHARIRCSVNGTAILHAHAPIDACDRSSVTDDPFDPLPEKFHAGATCIGLTVAEAALIDNAMRQMAIGRTEVMS